MRGRHATIVAAKECQEVLRQIAFVALGQRTHDSEIERDVLALVRRIDGDEDVARMHIGVEIAIAKHLREKNLDARASEPRNVDALLPEPFDLADRRSRHALHHHDFTRAPIPVDFGHEQQRRVQEVAPQLRAIGGFACEVEFVVDGLVEFGDDGAWPQALAVGPQFLDQHRARLHQTEILFDGRGDVRPQHLDRRRRAVGQFGQVHLRHRRAGDRLALEGFENLFHGFAVSALQCGQDLLAGKRRYPILQPGEFVGDIGRQQVAPCRQHLAELHENRAQILQRKP